MQSALETGRQPRVRFAEQGDYEFCRRLHRKHGTTYYFASRRLPRIQRQQVDALYGFVRVPDEWVDNPGDLTKEEVQSLLTHFRQEIIDAERGKKPSHPALRAFADVQHDLGMSLQEPLIFLDAMETDLVKTRYQTYAELEDYMRGSAAAVGLMMCQVIHVPLNPATTKAAMALGNAMQLTNFLRDIGEDLGRGRIYMPLEDLDRFGLGPHDLMARRVTPSFVEFMEFEIARARDLFRQADEGIPQIPSHSRLGVKLGRDLYSRILTKIEENGFDVFSRRARTSSWEKAGAAARAAGASLLGLG
jgi:15-cis-phytoene synthase